MKIPISFRMTAVLTTGAATAAVASLFRYAELQTGAGMPLDDSWIHLQFARNLAEGNGFAFNPGETTAGSTAPLWTLALAGLTLLPWEILGAVKVLGILLHWASSLFAVRLARNHGLEAPWALLVGLAVATTPRLVWGALSGMEIPLYLLLSTAGLWLHVERLGRSPSHLGTMLLALAVLARPECLILFPLCLVDRWRFDRAQTHRRLHLRHGLLYAAIIAPAIVFNLLASGNPLPNTYYAKVGSYGLLQAMAALDVTQMGKALVVYPLIQAGELGRFAVENSLFVSMASLLGLLELRRRNRADNGTSSWIIPLVLVAFPLVRGAVAPFKGPLFQHGRYAAFLVPLITVAGVLGLRALFEVLARGRPTRQVRRLRQWGIPVVAGLLAAELAVANIKYARIYALNVANINATHVKMGRWLARNTPPWAVVATHDIGAVGFFSNRYLYDTTGLVTPTVLKYLPRRGSADEGVARFLRDLKPDYLVLVPSWYPTLTRRIAGIERVFAIDVSDNSVVAGDRFVAYRLPWSSLAAEPVEPAGICQIIGNLVPFQSHLHNHTTTLR